MYMAGKTRKLNRKCKMKTLFMSSQLWADSKAQGGVASNNAATADMSTTTNPSRY
jgi:hypothetical protein